VPARDAPALADRLAAIAADADARKRFGEAGRSIATERFTIDRMVAELDALYAGLVPDGSEPGR
jgi:glycosyltransferase involved in cell wall biosynthesis